MLAYVLVVVYALFAAVAIGNALLMRRPKPREDGPTFCVLIPARDEEQNLRRLIPSLKEPNPGMKVYVYDDESSDKTGEVASSLGAILIRPRETLPAGWTGKNRACHELAQAAAEDSNADWFLFMDADARPGPQFIAAMRDLAKTCRRAGVLTGFPKIMSGRGLEPLFLGWVGWILLSMNPYGLVSRSGRGHNKFTNGQIHAWKSSIYLSLWPNERVKGAVLEDVKIGRLLADEGIKVEVANLSKHFAVKMYDTWGEALDGMSKNSYEITDSAPATIFLGFLMMLIAWGWLLAGHLIWVCLGLLLLSGLGTMAVVRVRPWGLPLLPLAISIGGFTLWRSLHWRRAGKVTWKGRTYPGPE